MALDVLDMAILENSIAFIQYSSIFSLHIQIFNRLLGNIFLTDICALISAKSSRYRMEGNFGATKIWQNWRLTKNFPNFHHPNLYTVKSHVRVIPLSLLTSRYCMRKNTVYTTLKLHYMGNTPYYNAPNFISKKMILQTICQIFLPPKFPSIRYSSRAWNRSRQLTIFRPVFPI